jgi:preprotein translocase subunit SecG
MIPLPHEFIRTSLVGVITAIFNTLIVLLSLFLICLVLIQRGKGGGLAGAFGGVGGSSAFGTKAGDTFTKITVVTAAIWIVMAMLLVVLTSRRTSSAFDSEPATSLTKELGSASKNKAKKSGTESSSPADSSAMPPASTVPPPLSSGDVPALPPSSTVPAIPEPPAIPK